jgi:hypothetical protein
MLCLFPDFLSSRFADAAPPYWYLSDCELVLHPSRACGDASGIVAVARGAINLETAVEPISRKDARTRSKRGRMVVGLSQEEHLFAQWVNRWISPSHSSHRVDQHFLGSNDFSGIKWARSQQRCGRGNASHREAFPQIRTQDGGHRNKFLGATDSRSDS